MAPISLDDVIVNQTNIHLARCQRLIASWLPPRSASELEQARTEAELEEEDKRIFIAEPEILGLGKTPPKAGVGQAEKLSNDVKLRRQMLGRDYDRKRKREEMIEAGSKPIGMAKPRPSALSMKEDYTSDEEAGRSSLGKPRKVKIKNTVAVKETAADDEETVPGQVAKEQAEKPKLWTSSYLDQLLEEKARKRKKKKKKKITKRKGHDNLLPN